MRAGKLRYEPETDSEGKTLYYPVYSPIDPRLIVGRVLAFEERPGLLENLGWHAYNENGYSNVSLVLDYDSEWAGTFIDFTYDDDSDTEDD